MFKDLLKFEVKRTFVQAIGFYLFYFILGGLLAAIISGLVQFQSGADYQTQYNIGLKIGSFFAIIYCPMLSLIILIKKKLYTSPVAIVLFLLTFIGVFMMACLLGCIVPAILSTFDSKADNN